MSDQTRQGADAPRSRMHTALTSRWVIAVVLAGAIAAWPACGTHGKATGAKANLNFALKDAAGKDVRLADFKGRPILLNFWATWCAPCKTEIPWFVEFTDKYKAQNLAVIGVSVDDDPAAIRKFAADHNINYPLLVGKGHDDLLTTYQAGDVIPVSWLIGADGTVATKVQGIHPGPDPKAWFETQLKTLF